MSTIFVITVLFLAYGGWAERVSTPARALPSMPARLNTTFRITNSLINWGDSDIANKPCTSYCNNNGDAPSCTSHCYNNGNAPLCKSYCSNNGDAPLCKSYCSNNGSAP